MKRLATWAAMGLGLWLAGTSMADAQERPSRQAGQIVFSSNRSGQWRIWCIRPDGSDLRQLTDGGPNDHDVDPVLSPDAKKILFSSTRGQTTGVWQMELPRPKPQRICDGDQAEWSPDARQIVFRRGQQLAIRDLATGEEKQITSSEWPHCSGPAWSPDGRSIAFACRWDAGNALCLVQAAGGQPVKVYDKKPACEPHWSPDSTRLVYETETQICTINPDGKKNRLVTYFGGVQRFGRFSPDGRWIVYCQGSSERGPWDLYLISAQGGEPVRLTNGVSDMNPDWK